MKIEEAIRKRRSVRAQKDKSVPLKKVEKIMNSVRMAPSAINRQKWKFIILNEEKR